MNKHREDEKSSSKYGLPTPPAVPNCPPQGGTRCHPERADGTQSSSSCSRWRSQRLPGEKENIAVVSKDCQTSGFMILLVQAHLIDHDWTACSLCFKEVLLVPEIIWFQIEFD